MISSYLVDEVTILRHEGTDSWGEPESGTMITVKAYVEWKTHIIRDIKGENVECPVKVYLSKKIERAAYLGRPLTHNDRIWIDGESYERTIVRIDQPKAFNMPHYEVYLT